MENLEQHIFSNLRARSSMDVWLFEHVLTLGKPTSSKATNLAMIWGMWDKLKPVREDPKGGWKYLNSWNSARADLVGMHATISKTTAIYSTDKLPPIEPADHNDPGGFLRQHVLNLPFEELDKEAEIKLLRLSVKILKKVKLTDETLNAYHRSRRLLIRHYLDAHYHAVSGL